LDSPLIILDADGVFLTERPYWDTALRAALEANGIDAPSDLDWRQLTDVAFGELDLQRVTKRRGCNSNWDLAAVLTEALGAPAVRTDVVELLEQRKWPSAIERLSDASNDLWSRDGESDPLAGFGVNRYGELYIAVQRAFQSMLTQSDAFTAPGDHSFCGFVRVVRAALAALGNAGFDLAVCTGRNRSELLAPLAAFNMVGCFNGQRIVTSDEVTRAERRINSGSLGKPHWFPAACAAVGFDAGCAAVVTNRLVRGADSQIVYVGDGIADFKCVAGAQSIGLDMRYIHVRSGVTDPKQERVIAEAPTTIAVVDSLTEAIGPLLDIRQGAAS